jgi:hypothetical protein
VVRPRRVAREDSSMSQPKETAGEFPREEVPPVDVAGVESRDGDRCGSPDTVADPGALLSDVAVIRG